MQVKVITLFCISVRVVYNSLLDIVTKGNYITTVQHKSKILLVWLGIYLEKGCL